MLRSIPLLIAISCPLAAKPLKIPNSFFSDPSFAREFVGSYGILSDVEPRVSPEEQELLGRVRELFGNSKFTEAEEEIRRFAEEAANPRGRGKEPTEISPSLIFVLGNLYFQAGRSEDARKNFLEAIKRFPRFRRAHTNLGLLYISQNKNDLALPMLQRAVELGESSGRVYGLIGYCHLSAENPLAAENAYRQAYLLDPRSRDWKLGLAEALMQQEKLAEAVSLFDTLIREFPTDRQLWLRQTSAFIAMDRKDDAIINLETMSLLNLADEKSLGLLGNLYMDQALSQPALSAYKAAMAKRAQLDVPQALKYARVLSEYGDPSHASELIASIRARLGPKPATETATALLLAEVRLSQQQGLNDATTRLLDELAAINPTHPEVLFETGRNKELQARNATDDTARGNLIAEARTHYQLASKHTSTAYPANLALGQLLVRERRYQDALTHLEAALQLKKSESLEQYVSRVRRAADRTSQQKSPPPAS